ncbi:MAG: nucleoside hydrolase [Clostridiales bacterium]|nr:nucleoside hydrolase [Clostridiales bacterium]
MDNILRMKYLERPTGPVDVVLDTDTYNEIDDQYALSYLIRSDDRLKLQAIYAAPFYNQKSSEPKDGMEKSYEEIMKILPLLGREDLKTKVYKGSENYLPDEHTPLDSPAARDLVERIRKREAGEPLYVVAIGAITNIASAILMAPEIIEKMVVVWLGGNAWEWHDNREFNLDQDVAAARIIFGCGVPLVQLPCMGVVSSFATTRYELEHWLKGKNPLCDYLLETSIRDGETFKEASCWSRTIWDVTAVAWLLNEKFMYERLDHSPIPEYDGHYSFDKRRHMIKYVYGINRDLLFEDLFRKLTDKCGK